MCVNDNSTAPLTCSDNLPINDNRNNFIGGVDHILFDKRRFDPSPDDIKRICRFFAIGKIKHYKKEKGIIISHSNFIVFVVTTCGQYALKFYPIDAAKRITMDYTLNRFLTKHRFPTPLMRTGHDGRPFLASNERLVTCFLYIDGLGAWQCLKQSHVIHQINSAMLSLKNLLSVYAGHPFSKQKKRFATTINDLAKASGAIKPYNQKRIIEAALLDACRTYQNHRQLFTRQWLHNNTSLSNMLIAQETVYTLDLSHIQEDYVLSDLASLVISCLQFKIPTTTTNNIIKDYLAQHRMEPRYRLVLNALITLGLVKAYLKNDQREKSPGLAQHPPNLVKAYRLQLSASKESIMDVLKNSGTARRF